jgi:hypothetical protein
MLCLVFQLWSPPILAAESLCGVGIKTWEASKLPAFVTRDLPTVEEVKKLSKSDELPYTVLVATLGVDGSQGLLVRSDFDRGQHAAPTRIYLFNKSKHSIIFSDDIGINETLVILPKISHGFYDLCDPSVCCGDNDPHMFRFDGERYRITQTP